MKYVFRMIGLIVFFIAIMVIIGLYAHNNREEALPSGSAPLYLILERENLPYETAYHSAD